MVAVVAQGASVAARAAVAEALHVHGSFADAARRWAALAEAGHDVAGCALKAAMSYLAAGDGERGRTWLDRAAGAGAPAADLAYVAAQRALGRGRVEAARAALEQACRHSPTGPAMAALGLVAWRQGERDEACRLFAQAAARDPADACARINLVSARLQEAGDVDLPDARRALAEAVAAAPHRPEPFVLFSRLPHGVTAEERRAALARARLRARVLGAPRAVAPVPPVGDARVTVRLDGALGVTARFALDPAATRPWPVTVRLNAGYDDVRIGGVAVAGTGVATAGAAIVAHDIPGDAWERHEGRWTLEVDARGTPRRPFARVDDAWIELGEGSGWVPVPGPGWRWRWDPRIDVPAGWTALVSTTRPTVDGFGLIALAEPVERVAHPNPRVTALGRVDRDLLATAAEVAAGAAARWEELLDRPVPAAPVVVLDRPGSVFCYHRPGFTRVTADVAGGSQRPLIAHEVGHRWWGGQVAVPAADRWLAEALAEYTLHLVADPDRTSYRAATLAALRRLGGGTLPPEGLARLAGRPGPEAAYVLRAKGGWMVSMLRAVVGDGAFRATLRAACDLGADEPLDGYTFFALASYFHGAALDWFANQWVYTDAAMGLRVDDVEVGHGAAAGHTVAFQARCTGFAVPGAPVEFLVRSDGGDVVTAANLDLCGTEVRAVTPGRPRSVTVDCGLRWYADVSRRVVSL